MRTASGFTLVELLVVFTITSILASMIAVGISGAKGHSKSMVCVSNLKQLGLASQMYWDDNAQQTFPFSSSRDENGQSYWFGWLGAGLEGKRELDRTSGAIWHYLGGRGVQLCPSFRYQDPSYKPKAMSASYGYGYNLHLTGFNTGISGLQKGGLLMSQVASASSTALFADSAQINDFQRPASPDQPMIEEFYFVSRGSAMYANGHFRHRRRAQTVFCDGHVSPETPENGTTDFRLPDAGVARLRADVLIP